ncbi:MAG: CCA tRNA nucleotidyltransferase [Bacteroides sp.]|nr:CCA tRNA nucleotidyltransferase [Bacteroides sp.]MCM1412844.1 CCA tRNA nucleotidyltransferase [Bacteroides sp.]MCM1471513.1 CCA tRNA nucleotidyltransferase [Bacteroides sp.]
MTVVKLPTSKAFQAVADAADSLALPCYAVGGYVRDLFLNRHSKDIDFVSVGPGSGISIASEVARHIGRGAKVNIFRTYGTAQVMYHDTELEFVGARKESYHRESRNPIVEEGTLEDDISRRDFTINAMAISVNKDTYGTLIDRFGGIDDLNNRIIRTPLDPDITFSDDPLRMMRAVRFATQLDFTIHPDTLDAITRNADRIDIITRERIATELMKIMQSPRPSIGWRLLAATGLLIRILPQLDAMQGVEVIHGRGHKDNFDHTMLVLDRVAAQSDNVWLRWAALLHDIAKPVTKRWDESLGWTFHNHNFIGGKMIPKIFKSLKMTQSEPMKYVKKLVELHMRPIALVEETVTDSAVRRLIVDAGEDIDDLMILCRADITSRNPEKVQRHLKNFENVLQKIADVNERDHLRLFQPPVSGEEIMATFSLPPSQPVGIIKSEIKEAIIEGIIPNDHDAAYAYMLEIGRRMGLTV